MDALNQRDGSEVGGRPAAVTTALAGSPARGGVSVISRSLGFEKRLPCILQVLGAGNPEGLTGQVGDSGAGESGEESRSHSSLRRGQAREGWLSPTEQMGVRGDGES